MEPKAQPWVEPPPGRALEGRQEGPRHPFCRLRRAGKGAPSIAASADWRGSAPPMPHGATGARIISTASPTKKIDPAITIKSSAAARLLASSSASPRFGAIEIDG